MNGDRALRTALARADAALPPPAGTIVTAASLHARLRRRRVLRALAATLLLSAGAAAFAVARAPARPNAPPARIPAALRRQLGAELAELQNRLARLDDADAAIEGELRRSGLAVCRAAIAGERTAIALQIYAAGRAGNERHR
jgi:hypothetical protein